MHLQPLKKGERFMASSGRGQHWVHPFLALTVAIFFCAAYVPALSGQDAEVSGWGKVTWGMTPSEVAKAYEGQIEISKARDDGGYIYRLPNYEIFRKLFSVTFMWSQTSQRLNGALVSHKCTVIFDNKNKRWERVPENCTTEYSQCDRLIWQIKDALKITLRTH